MIKLYILKNHPLKNWGIRIINAIILKFIINNLNSNIMMIVYNIEMIYL